jgi:hypothetical protein
MLTPIQPQPLSPAVREFLREVQGVRDEALIAIRDYATAAKGTGKPSLLDIGPLYGDIRSHLGDRSVQGAPASLLGRLQLMQSRAFNRAWADVAATVKKAECLIDPGENLTRATELVDRLVNDGILYLPRTDFPEAYREARTKLSPGSMDVYRRLTEKMTAEMGPGDLWDICIDPLPPLEALIQYATLSRELLDGMSITLVPTLGGGPSDVGALIEGFRELANLLDDVARLGGH